MEYGTEDLGQYLYRYEPILVRIPYQYSSAIPTGTAGCIYSHDIKDQVQ